MRGGVPLRGRGFRHALPHLAAAVNRTLTRFVDFTAANTISLTVRAKDRSTSPQHIPLASAAAISPASIAMITLSVRNFRSFEADAVIELRPLTFLLGRNNSGKSTITRLIPLLQQSFAQRTSGPILWTGSQVDFGTIQDVKPKWNPNAEVSIGFQLPNATPLNNLFMHPPYVSALVENSPVSYEATLNADEDVTTFAGFDLKINGDDITFRIDQNGVIQLLRINDNDYTSLYAEVRAILRTQSLFPDIKYVTPSGESPRSVRNEAPAIYNRRRSLIRQLSHGRTKDATINEISTSIPYRSRASFLEAIRRNGNLTPFFKDQISSRAEYDPNSIETLRISLLLTNLTDIIAALGSYIRGIFSSAVYVGPIRASGERYYRWQELAVDRLDPRGENLAMYLNSLTDNELEHVSSSLAESFGYRVRRQRTRGHVSIEISAEQNRSEWYNIVDMGHGFSQLLPVVAQIHAATVSRRLISRRITRQSLFSFEDQVRIRERIIAIEQPELHLHPAFQGRLGSLFENSIYTNEAPSNDDYRTPSGMYYVLETHSESLINAIGELVFSKRINPKDVAIYIFDKGPNGRTTVSHSYFREDGTLSDWPTGFFLYEQNDI